MRKAQLRLQRDTDVPHESIGRVVYPADCGRHVRCGARQSMEHYRFTEKLKDKSDRSRLVEIMENLPAVTAWRQGLTPDERRRYTHPTTVFRQWKTALRKSAEAESPDVWRPSVSTKLKAAQAEIHKLRKEGAAAPWGPADPPYQRARAVMEVFGLSIVESEQLAMALLQHVQEQRGAGSDRDAPSGGE